MHIIWEIRNWRDDILKKQIIAGITATMTIAGNAATVIHAEDDADYNAPISEETETQLNDEQQQALAGACSRYRS